MSSTIYDSPDDQRFTDGSLGGKFDELSIDLTVETAWFFGHKRNDEMVHICVPITELQAISSRLNEYLASMAGLD
jgi:hypothetical protein